MRIPLSIAAMAISALSLVGPTFAAPAAPNTALARMPVKEITVFKNGAAFLIREGVLPTDSSGDVLMDDLPTPILGTFWVYSTDARAKVVSVSARPRRVLVERTALSLWDLIQANPGAIARVDEVGDKPAYEATLLGVPERSSEEVERTSPPNTGEQLPRKADVALMKTDEGFRVAKMDRIESVTFRDDPKRTLVSEEFRNLLTVRLDGPARRANATAPLGMMYVQRGVRWIPSYRVTLDGKGGATLELQATIVNEEADLDNVTMNLVVGVPSFAFSDTPDPISLQQTFAQVERALDRASQLSNAVMTQVPNGGFGGTFAPSAKEAAMPGGPEVAGAERAEDLFVFTVKNVTIRKGERLVTPISRRSLKYKDVYTLTLPYGPPADVARPGLDAQQTEVARLLAAPKVQHKIRLQNDKDEPLTTAPALILRADKVLGQAMMTYTPVSGEVDIPITVAVDVTVARTERETGRVPSARRWGNENLSRVDIKGNIALRNHRDEAVALEVTRYVLGEMDTVDHGGVIEKVNALDDTAAADAVRPGWWGYYNWPYWFNNVNGVGRATWTFTLPAGSSADLGYTWHYFWQ